MLLKFMVLGVALIAGTLLSSVASAQDESPAASSPTTGLNEIPQLRGPIINQSSSMTDKPEEINSLLRRTNSSRVPKYSDRVNVVNDPGKLPGTGPVGVIGSGQLSQPSDFERRGGSAW